MALAEQPFFDPTDHRPPLVAVPTPFSVTREAAGPVVRLVLRGELDLASAGELRTAVDAWLPAGRPMTIDLDQLEFIDSSGIVELLRAVRLAREHRTELHLTRGSARVQRVFELCVLDRVLPFA